MSEELTVLKEYFDSLKLNRNGLTHSDLAVLSNELYDAEEFTLAKWVSNLNKPSELLEYIDEEE